MTHVGANLEADSAGTGRPGWDCPPPGPSQVPYPAPWSHCEAAAGSPGRTHRGVEVKVRRGNPAALIAQQFESPLPRGGPLLGCLRRGLQGPAVALKSLCPFWRRGAFRSSLPETDARRCSPRARWPAERQGQAGGGGLLVRHGDICHGDPAPGLLSPRRRPCNKAGATSTGPGRARSAGPSGRRGRGCISYPINIYSSD